MKKTALVLVMFTQICAHAYGQKLVNQKEFDWLMGKDATYSCTALCIEYRKSPNIDVNKMIDYGSFDNCGTADAPEACTKVNYNQSVNIRHSFEQLNDLCWRNGFNKIIAAKSACDVVSTHQECSDDPSDRGKPVALRCKEIENWRVPLDPEFVRKGLLEVGAKLAD